MGGLCHPLLLRPTDSCPARSCKDIHTFQVWKLTCFFVVLVLVLVLVVVVVVVVVGTPL